MLDLLSKSGWWAKYIPGDEERGVVVRGMAVILDVLALLPDAEVV